MRSPGINSPCLLMRVPAIIYHVKQHFKNMKKISYETVQNFCRACLKELKQRHRCELSNLNLQIRHWLGDITIDDPLSSDIYSRSICQTCRSKLKEFLEFHIMCKQSRKTVDNLLANVEENKLNYPNNKISNADNTNPDKGLLERVYLTNAYSDLVAEEAEEALICKININDSKSISQSDNNSVINFGNVDIGSGEHVKPDCSDGVMVESAIHTESESEIKIKDDVSTLNEKSICSTKVDSELYKPTAERKKYTYLFRCDQCKYRSISQQYLDIHMRTHKGLNPYQCPHCDDNFNKSTILLKHLNNIHGQKELNIICEHEQCAKSFTSSRNYKDHYRQNHLPQNSNKKQEKPFIKSTQRHVCEECGKVYTKLQTFKEHQYTHRPKDLYPFQCDVCDKAFVKRRTYNEHKLRHEGIKNFECPHCGVKRTTRKELKEHMNSHTRERQYPCPNCPMIFYRTSNRRVHIDVVHLGIRRFACRYCDQTFGKGDNLKNHVLLHTGEKPHVCLECGKRFVQKVSLRLHVKTHYK